MCVSGREGGEGGEGGVGGGGTEQERQSLAPFHHSFVRCLSACLPRATDSDARGGGGQGKQLINKGRERNIQ